MLLMTFEKRRIGWKCLNWKLKWNKWLIECFCLIFILDSHSTFFNWLRFEDKLSFRFKVPPIKILRKPTVGTLTLVKTEVILEIKVLNVIFNGLDLSKHNVLTFFEIYEMISTIRTIDFKLRTFSHDWV